jgi:threonine/homoserine/homoserine lactone efflux protein
LPLANLTLREHKKTASIISVIAGVNIVCFLIILPYATTKLQNATVLRNQIDLYVTRISHSLLILGAALMALAWTSTGLF